MESKAKEKISGYEYGPGNTQRAIDTMLKALRNQHANWTLNPSETLSAPYTKTQLRNFFSLISTRGHSLESIDSLLENLCALGILVTQTVKIQTGENFPPREGQNYKINIPKLKTFDKSSGKSK